MLRFVQEKVISLDVEDDISDVQWLNDSGWFILSLFSIASIPAYGNGNKTVFLAIADAYANQNRDFFRRQLSWGASNENRSSIHGQCRSVSFVQLYSHTIMEKRPLASRSPRS